MKGVKCEVSRGSVGSCIEEDTMKCWVRPAEGLDDVVSYLSFK